MSAESLLRRRRMEAPEIGDVDRLTPREVKALFPPLHAGFAGVHVAGGARVDGRRLVASLLRAAKHHGARVARGFVELISRDRVPGVRLDDRNVVADAVVVTAGAWSPALLSPLGINLPIQPQRGRSYICICPDKRQKRGRSSCHREVTTCWRSTILASSPARRGNWGLGLIIE